MIKCSKCGTSFDASLLLGATGEVSVATCRVCPGGVGFAICERCADLDQVQMSPCPRCGAEHLWQIDSMLPVKKWYQFWK